MVTPMRCKISNPASLIMQGVAAFEGQEGRSQNTRNTGHPVPQGLNEKLLTDHQMSPCSITSNNVTSEPFP